MKNWQNLVQITAIQLVLLIIIGVSAGLDSSQKLNSLGLGALVSSTNILLLWITWSFILFKKNVAPVLALVVFKYSILIILLAFLGDRIEDKLFFIIGVLSVPAAIGIFGVLRALRLLKKV